MAIAADTASGLAEPWKAQPESVAQADAAAEYLVDMGVTWEQVQPYLNERLVKQKVSYDSRAARFQRLGVALERAKQRTAAAPAK
jgi:hypothetical protein